MKILCDRHQLNEGFNVVAGIAPLKSPKPIVQNVLLRADDQGLTLMATDFEMSARVTLASVKVDKQGSTLLPAREASALFRELSDPTVSITSKQARSTIESGGGSFVLVGEDPEQFPVIPELAGQTSAKLPAGRFLTMVKRTAFAAAKEETRYSINGVLLDIKKGTLRLVATDGRRLALTYEGLEGSPKDVSAIVPSRALAALARAIPEDSTETLEIQFGENQIGFRLGATCLISRILDARFPEYESVIPKAADTTVELSRDLLASSLRKTAVMATGDLRMVRLEFNSSSLQLSAESQSGRADVTMDCDVKGAGGSIRFNPDFLLDALKVAEMDVVRLDMSDDATPAKLTLGEAFTYVLMPISGS